MKLRIIFLAVILMFVFVFSGCEKKTAEGEQVQSDLDIIKKADVLNVGIRYNAKKFSIKDGKEGAPKGYEIDLASEIAKKLLGKAEKVNFAEVTAENRADMIQNGTVDIIIAGYSANDERKSFFHLSPSYYTDSIAIAVNKDSGIESFKSLRGSAVGVVKNAKVQSVLADESSRLAAQIDFIQYADFSRLEATLSADKIKGIAGYTSALSTQIDKDMVLLKERFSPQEYCVIVNKQNTELAAFIDETVVSLAKSKQLKKMQEANGIVS